MRNYLLPQLGCRICTFSEPHLLTYHYPPVPESLVASFWGTWAPSWWSSPQLEETRSRGVARSAQDKPWVVQPPSHRSCDDTKREPLMSLALMACDTQLMLDAPPGVVSVVVVQVLVVWRQPDFVYCILRKVSYVPFGKTKTVPKSSHQDMTKRCRPLKEVPFLFYWTKACPSSRLLPASYHIANVARYVIHATHSFHTWGAWPEAVGQWWRTYVLSLGVVCSAVLQ